MPGTGGESKSYASPPVEFAPVAAPGDPTFPLLQAESSQALADAVQDLLGTLPGCHDPRLQLPPDRSPASHAPTSHAAKSIASRPPDDIELLEGVHAHVTLHDGGSDVSISIQLPQGCATLAFRQSGDTRLALQRLAGPLGIVRLRLPRLLRAERLQRSLQAAERHEQVQRALYAIADLAYADLDIHDMLARVHSIIRELTYAENLMIVQCDASTDQMRVLYYEDVQSPVSVHEGQVVNLENYPNSLTLALLRDGRPLMGSSAQLRERLGLVNDARLGAESEDWLGVPMTEGEQIRGAVVIQSYDKQHHYSVEDMALLSFVAQHTLAALTRKQVQDGLEGEVRKRTRELARVNDELRNEVAERERSQKLQAALFRIAEMAGERGSLHDFYAGVHDVMGGLVDARNFFIALLNAPGDMLEFAYFVDELDEWHAARYLTKGVSEYVLRTRQPLLADAAKLKVLNDAGETVVFGSAPECWLGVPLLLEDRCLGLIVVQSYIAGRGFTHEDQEVLSFASYHIAAALERKQVQERLKLAYEELELRVEDRTRELKHANTQLHAQIAVREKVESRLKHQAWHDALTGLPNRAALLERMGLALERYKQDRSRQFALLFMDLDRFKVVNDSVGHPVGDELLIEAGRRIASCIRDGDSVARLGGDEFTILLEPIEGEGDACTIAGRVLASLVDPVRIGDKEIYTSVSIGIALCDPRYETAEELVRDADVAMYRAKAGGRQRYEIFDQHLHEEAMLALDMESDLRRAIINQEFEPYLQPIVRLEDGGSIGYEALLRWNHAKRGVLLPRDFLSQAEDTGSIEQIDWLLFEAVCRQLSSLQSEHGYVGINVSARHFRSPSLSTQLLELLQAYDVPPQRIRIEVTEGALLDNPDRARLTMLRLRDAGVLTTLDDFGTGYSSLSYLHRFPLHALKIDRSFVSDLQPDLSGSSGAVVKAILALAGSLGMETIAEGIETPVQRDALLKLKCTVGQGFLFAKPQRFAEFSGRER